MEESCHVWIGCVTHMKKSWMSHGANMNESCHIRMSHGTHMHESWVRHGTQTDAGTKAEATCMRIRMRHSIWEWVMTHMEESCLTWRSHVMYGGVMSHMKESCHVWIGCVTHMNKSWMSHGTNMNESWVSHGTQTDAGTKAEAMCLFIERLLLQVYSFAIHII